jgi:hypothetical protein
MKNYSIEAAGGAKRTGNSTLGKELLPLQPTPGSPASPSILNLPEGSGKWRPYNGDDTELAQESTRPSGLGAPLALTSPAGIQTTKISSKRQNL